MVEQRSLLSPIRDMTKQKRRSNRRRGQHKRDVTLGSGNIFGDLESPDAEELLAKADLVHAIQALLRQRDVSQRAAAGILGVAQPDLSKLLRGQLVGFSIERLVRMLNALDQDVRIVVQPKPSSRRRGTFRATLRKTA